MTWNQIFKKLKRKPCLFVIYLQKLKCKFSHLKSTPLLRDQCLESRFKFTHRVYKCIFVHISTGIWPQWNLDANSTAFLRHHFLFLHNRWPCSSAGETPSIWIFCCCTYIIYKKTTSIFQTMVCKQFLSKLSLLEKLKSCINTMESTDTASIQWIIIHSISGHCGIRCLTLYFDVSWYWVIGLSAIPHVPTPTFPFTLSGDANMLLFTYKKQ